MKTWIALFRGINVGGNNLLPMAKLRRDLESLKLKNVRTYIQSGNVIFDSRTKSAAPLVKKIGSMIEKNYGFHPKVLLLDCQEFQAAVQANPFPKAVAEPKTLHFYFLEEPATAPDIKSLDDAKKPTEKYIITDRVFYLHAAEGIGHSKLATYAGKYLGVVTTARNYRTVEKILGLITQPEL